MSKSLNLNEIKELWKELEAEKFAFAQLAKSNRGTDKGNSLEGTVNGLDRAIDILKRHTQIQ